MNPTTIRKKLPRTIGLYTAVFIALIVLFTASMTLVFCIPEKMLEWHVESSNYTFNIQSGWLSYFSFGTDAALDDYGDDNLMINHVLKEDPQMNALEAAMSINGYSRYWHGYLVWLRPLMVLYNQGQLRYFYMMVFFMLLCLLFVSMAQIIKKKKGVPAAMAMSIALSACYLTVVPTCMQYAHVFLIAMSACILLLRYYDQIQKYLPLFFMVIGMFTCFVDFLTAPLLTLGLPLLMYLFILNQNTKEFSWKDRLWTIFSCSALWAVGYIGCWACKWILSCLVLNVNEFDVAFDKVNGWTSTAGADSRMLAIEKNFHYYFLEHGLRIYLVFAIPLLVLLARIIRFTNKEWYKGLVYLPVTIFPYLWYLVINGHSHYHPFFSHRIQAITTFGVLLFMIDLARWDNEEKTPSTQE